MERAAQELGGRAHAVGVTADPAGPPAASGWSRRRTRYGGLDGALISVGGPPAGHGRLDTDDDLAGAFETVFLGALRAGPAGRRRGRRRRRLDRVRAVARCSSRSPGWPSPTGCGPAWRWLAKTLADELGPRGIRVNGLLPGRIDDRPDPSSSTAGGDPDGARAAGRGGASRCGRYGEPDEFGRVAAFVLSPAASYITGAMIPVDGGMIRCAG